MSIVIHCDVCHEEHTVEEFTACEACYNDKAEIAEEEVCKCEEKDKEIDDLEDKIAELKDEIKDKNDEIEILNNRIEELETELERQFDGGMQIGGSGA
jgi:predicted RNase H-like nuclease (RuvC/YqgF family)